VFVWYVCVYVYLLRMCVCCVVLNHLVRVCVCVLIAHVRVLCSPKPIGPKPIGTQIGVIHQ
jgi:hypothetical protein